MSQLIVHEFNGVKIPCREDGYFNLTAMAKVGGKRVRDWLRLRSSQAFIGELSSKTQICALKLVEVTRGGSQFVDRQTYAHYQVALEFARWISPEFAIVTNEWIKARMEGRSPEEVQPVQSVPLLPAAKGLGATIKEVKAAKRLLEELNGKLTDVDRKRLSAILREALR